MLKQIINPDTILPLCFGSIALLLFLLFFESHAEEFCGGVVEILGSLHDAWEEHRHQRPVRQRQRRVRKWDRAVRRITAERQKHENKQAQRHADKISRNAIAETLATHQEILETIYGSDAPIVSDVVKRTMSKHHFN